MKPSGSITFFSGILSRRPGHNDAMLAGVNAAVEAIGRALARYLAPVRVNTLSPGMTRGTGAYLSMPETAREGMCASIASHLPAGRVGFPQDIAAATLMLMTNGFITGVTLDVNGGGWRRSPCLNSTKRLTRRRRGPSSSCPAAVFARKPAAN